MSEWMKNWADLGREECSFQLIPSVPVEPIAEIEYVEDDEREFVSLKEMSRSARAGARRPLIGNKSSGGKARIVTVENKLYKTVISRRGAVFDRPDRRSQHAGGVVRGNHYKIPTDETVQRNDVYTSFAFKTEKNKPKKNKSRRDRIFVE